MVSWSSHSGYSNGKEPFSRHLCFCGGGLLQGSPTQGKVVEIFAWDHVERTGSKPWKLETTNWSHHLRGIWIFFLPCSFSQSHFSFFDVCICIYVLGLSRINTGKPIFLFRAASTPQQEAGLIMEKLWSTSGRRPWGWGSRILNVLATPLMDPFSWQVIELLQFTTHVTCLVRLDCIDCGNVFTRFQWLSCTRRCLEHNNGFYYGCFTALVVWTYLTQYISVDTMKVLLICSTHRVGASVTAWMNLFHFTVEHVLWDIMRLTGGLPHYLVAEVAKR